MAKKKTVGEKLKETSVEEISKWDEAKRRSELKKYITAYKRRVTSFKKAGITSYAEVAYQREGSVPTKLPSLSSNQLLYEIARLQAFFQSESSTTAGAKKINREQDMRIFGKGENGAPRYTMSESQRETYWRVYDEYYNQYREKATSYGSDTVQQMLGQIVSSTELTPDDLMASVAELDYWIEERKAIQEENLGASIDVFSGFGNA